MQPNRVLNKRVTWASVLTLLLLILFQNCSAINFEGHGSRGAQLSGSGNGTGYEGKIVSYRYFDSANPCSAQDTHGQALANAIIFQSTDQEFSLVRDQCLDIAPTAISRDDIKILDSTHIEFQARSFENYLPVVSNIAVPDCPSGRTLRVGVSRENLMSSPIDFTAPVWGSIAGMSAALDGNFSGLPAFKITRTTANSEDWRRWDQWQNIKASTHYALSFIAKSGNSNQIRLTVFQDTPNTVDSGGVWDLVSGGLVSSWNNGLLETSYSSKPVPGGLLVTFFFTTSVSTLGLDMGVASESRNSGDYIFATGAQLEEVDTYCGP